MGNRKHPSDETVQLTALVPDPRNARRHNGRNLALIEASLREVGAARSIVVDEGGVILAGNATVALPARTVPVSSTTMERAAPTSRRLASSTLVVRAFLERLSKPWTGACGSRRHEQAARLG